MMNLTRRGLLGALFVAPAIIRSGVLMPIRPPVPSAPPTLAQLLGVGGALEICDNMGVVLTTIPLMAGAASMGMIHLQSDAPGLVQRTGTAASARLRTPAGVDVAKMPVGVNDGDFRLDTRHLSIGQALHVFDFSLGFPAEGR